jgi:hypothetical protein
MSLLPLLPISMFPPSLFRKSSSLKFGVIDFLNQQDCKVFFSMEP